MTDPPPADSDSAATQPRDASWGPHTARAMENFTLLERPVDLALVRAFGTVKLAAVRTARALGEWATETAKADAIERACHELADGALPADVVPVDALHGGAGTSTNLAVCEALAQRAATILGDDTRVDPLGDLNRFQSTNDVFPTALRLAAICRLRDLEARVVALQETFQEKEKAFADIVKVGRTQLQDAVLTTLGRSMGAFAEALNRDRWRIYKCEERLRVVNLGGTAIGTGLGAPRAYIFRVVDTLRELTGIGFARAENLVEATQNADVFVEVSGILKAHATTLWKIAGDLRLMSSGPEAGLGEIALPARQIGSTIMPGKVNPVIPEAVTQAAMLAIGHDQVIAMAASQGSLELNPFLPLIAHALLESLRVLANADDILRRHGVEGITANPTRCATHVDTSTATVTALLPLLGYTVAERLVQKARDEGRTIRDVAVSEGLLDAATFDATVTPEAVTRLGSPPMPKEERTDDSPTGSES